MAESKPVTPAEIRLFLRRAVNYCHALDLRNLQESRRIHNLAATMDGERQVTVGQQALKVVEMLTDEPK